MVTLTVSVPEALVRYACDQVSRGRSPSVDAVLADALRRRQQDDAAAAPSPAPGLPRPRRRGRPPGGGRKALGLVLTREQIEVLRQIENGTLVPAEGQFEGGMALYVEKILAARQRAALEDTADQEASRR